MIQDISDLIGEPPLTSLVGEGPPPWVEKVHIGDATLVLGDCLDVMPTLGVVDLILADLPYGTTQNKWDSVIPLDVMWAHFKRVMKPNGATVLTAQAPFDKALGASNLEQLKYEWIWEKEMGSGHLNAKKAPLKNHENVLVFYERQPTYNPQFDTGAKPYKAVSGRGAATTGRRLRRSRKMTDADTPRRSSSSLGTRTRSTPRRSRSTSWST
jgi:hypothetical protein